MSRSPVVDRVMPLLQRCADELGLDLEEVTLTAAGKRSVLRVALDRDGGVTLDAVAEATKLISHTLDEDDALMGQQAYTLEVSSRGTSSPLIHPRHWRRNVGRLVKVTPADGDVVTGRIVDHDEDETGGARLRVPGTGPDDEGEIVEVAYASVRRAKIQVELNRKES